MKKVILLSFAMLFAVCLMAQKKKVALISKVVANRTDVTPQSTDVDKDFILPLLTDYDVTTVLSSTATPDLSTYDLIILSETAGSTDAAISALKGLNKPMLIMKVHHYKPDDARNRSWGWTPANVTGGAQYYGQDMTQTSVTINDTEHPIFKTPNVVTNEIFSKLDLNTSSTAPISIGLGWVDATAMAPAYSAGNIKVLATANGSDTQTAILEIVKGATVNSTNTVGTTTPVIVPQKYIQIGIAAVNYHNLTQNAKNLILNTCNYLLAPATGLNAPKLSDNWSVFVNSNKQIELTNMGVQTQAMQVEIFDMKGTRLISAKMQATDKCSIDASHLKTGAYILSAITNQGVAKKSFVISE